MALAFLNNLFTPSVTIPEDLRIAEADYTKAKKELADTHMGNTTNILLTANLAEMFQKTWKSRIDTHKENGDCDAETMNKVIAVYESTTHKKYVEEPKKEESKAREETASATPVSDSSRPALSVSTNEDSTSAPASDFILSPLSENLSPSRRLPKWTSATTYEPRERGSNSGLSLHVDTEQAPSSPPRYAPEYPLDSYSPGKPEGWLPADCYRDKDGLVWSRRPCLKVDKEKSPPPARHYTVSEYPADWYSPKVGGRLQKWIS